MQIKASLRFHLTSVSVAKIWKKAFVNVGKGEHYSMFARIQIFAAIIVISIDVHKKLKVDRSPWGPDTSVAHKHALKQTIPVHISL